jgi:hypothetical protein
MRRYQFINYSEGVNNLDLNYMHPSLLLLLAHINLFCLENDLEFKITSIFRSAERDKQLGAVSKTHQEGRAIDVSIYGWDDEVVDFLEAQINDLVEIEHLENGAPNPFYQIGAISSKDFKQRAIVVHNNHDGPGGHAHIQVRGGGDWAKKTHRR